MGGSAHHPQRRDGSTLREVAGRGGERPGHEPARLRRRTQTWLFSLALLVLVLGTAAGVVLARERAVDAVQDRARLDAENGAALLEIELQEVAAGLTGIAAVIGPDGSLDAEVFRAFAGDPLDAADPRELALLAVVTDAERADFEARTGVTISAVDGRGDIVPAPAAPVHNPVLVVEPDLPGRAFVGWDIRSDPPRRAVLEAAQRTRAAAVGAVTDLTGDGSTVMLVVRPILDGADQVRGFVGTGIPVARLLEAIETPMGGDATVVLVEG
ncbi:MAG TPA: CHASE domain-containing protein, partial [Acidimicrobiales bacterium]